MAVYQYGWRDSSNAYSPDSIPFDTRGFTSNGLLNFTGPPQLPARNERGWKDSVQTPPGFVTRVIMKFGPFIGRYVYHCHILEHEDYDMMRPFEVVEDKCDYKLIGTCESSSSEEYLNDCGCNDDCGCKIRALDCPSKEADKHSDICPVCFETYRCDCD